MSNRTACTLLALSLSAALLAGCGAPDRLPQLQGQVCDFRYRTLGTTKVVTDRETLIHRGFGWRRAEPQGCATGTLIHTLPDGSAYRFAEGALDHTMPGGQAARLTGGSWPAFTDMTFRAAWPRTRIQGTVMNAGPLHAYGLAEDGTLWDIRLDESGNILHAGAVERLPDGWKPLAIDAPAGLRVAILASNGERTMLFHYRMR